MDKLPKIIVILGPTASGKTEMAIKLAKKFNGEIISADSRAIYKWMEIGTAKPSSKEIKHHLVDIVRPDEEFTLVNFKKRAFRAINSILKRGKIPFLVGGTGLYIQTMVDNLSIPKVKSDKNLRKKLEKETIERLLKRLTKIDPKAAEKIGRNKRKLIRALEVYIKTGKKFSEIIKKDKPLFDVLQIGIMRPREILYKRINFRARQIIEKGLIEEVKNIVKKLKKRGISEKKIWQLPSMSGIGYKQIGIYLRGEIDLAEAIRILSRDTRHYAKRQITWFKRDKNIKWVKDYKSAENLIKKFLKK